MVSRSKLFNIVLGGFDKDWNFSFDFRSYRSHGIFTNNHQCTSHIVTPTQENWIIQCNFGLFQ